MASVEELSDPYANFMRNALAPAAPDVCSVCTTFTTGGYTTCYPCGRAPRYADAVMPISYSEGHGQLHHALRGYKQMTGSPASRLRLELAAVLWRFVARHEGCLARAVGAPAFDLVTTVPSSSLERDLVHPLPEIVKVVGPLRDRFEPLLARSDAEVPSRQFSRERFSARRALAGEHVLLIDDTWTTGANAQSAAFTLKDAGAGAVGLLVIGRHVTPDYAENAARLAALPRRFDWDRCALE